MPKYNSNFSRGGRAHSGTNLEGSRRGNSEQKPVPAGGVRQSTQKVTVEGKGKSIRTQMPKKIGNVNRNVSVLQLLSSFQTKPRPQISGQREFKFNLTSPKPNCFPALQTCNTPIINQRPQIKERISIVATTPKSIPVFEDTYLRSVHKAHQEYKEFMKAIEEEHIKDAMTNLTSVAEAERKINQFKTINRAKQFKRNVRRTQKSHDQINDRIEKSQPSSLIMTKKNDTEITGFYKPMTRKEKSHFFPYKCLDQSHLESRSVNPITTFTHSKKKAVVKPRQQKFSYSRYYHTKPLKTALIRKQELKVKRELELLRKYKEGFIDHKYIPSKRRCATHVSTVQLHNGIEDRMVEKIADKLQPAIKPIIDKVNRAVDDTVATLDSNIQNTFVKLNNKIGESLDDTTIQNAVLHEISKISNDVSANFKNINLPNLIKETFVEVSGEISPLSIVGRLVLGLTNLIQFFIGLINIFITNEPLSKYLSISVVTSGLIDLLLGVVSFTNFSTTLEALITKLKNKFTRAPQSGPNQGLDQYRTYDTVSNHYVTMHDDDEVEKTFITNVFDVVDKNILNTSTRFNRGARFVSDFHAYLTKGSTIIEYFINLIKGIIEYVQDKFDPQKFNRKLLTSHRDMKDWLSDFEEVMAYMRDYDPDQPPTVFDHSEYDRVKSKMAALIKRGKIIEQDLLMNRSPAVKAYFTKQFKELNEIYISKVGSASSRRRRQEPYVIAFVGASAIGKTCIYKQFYKDVQACFGRHISNVDGEIYINDPSYDYYDGYTGQELFVFDDMYQFRDTDPIIRENMTLNKLKGRQPVSLPCAALANKDSTFFVSKMIIATLNAKPDVAVVDLDGTLLLEPISAVRRFDTTVIVQPKEQYRTKQERDAHGYYKFDPVIVNSQVYQNRFEMLEFAIYHKGVFDKLVGYDDFVINLATRYRKHLDIQNEMDKLDAKPSKFEQLFNKTVETLNTTTALHMMAGDNFEPATPIELPKENPPKLHVAEKRIRDSTKKIHGKCSTYALARLLEANPTVRTRTIAGKWTLERSLRAVAETLQKYGHNFPTPQENAKLMATLFDPKNYRVVKGAAKEEGITTYVPPKAYYEFVEKYYPKDPIFTVAHVFAVFNVLVYDPDLEEDRVEFFNMLDDLPIRIADVKKHTFYLPGYYTTMSAEGIYNLLWDLLDKKTVGQRGEILIWLNLCAQYEVFFVYTPRILHNDEFIKFITVIASILEQEDEPTRKRSAFYANSMGVMTNTYTKWDETTVIPGLVQEFLNVKNMSHQAFFLSALDNDELESFIKENGGTGDYPEEDQEAVAAQQLGVVIEDDETIEDPLTIAPAKLQEKIENLAEKLIIVNDQMHHAKVNTAVAYQQIHIEEEDPTTAAVLPLSDNDIRFKQQFESTVDLLAQNGIPPTKSGQNYLWSWNRYQEIKHTFGENSKKVLDAVATPLKKHFDQFKSRKIFTGSVSYSAKEQKTEFEHVLAEEIDGLKCSWAKKRTMADVIKPICKMILIILGPILAIFLTGFGGYKIYQYLTNKKTEQQPKEEKIEVESMSVQPKRARRGIKAEDGKDPKKPVVTSKINPEVLTEDQVKECMVESPTEVMFTPATPPDTTIKMQMNTRMEGSQDPNATDLLQLIKKNSFRVKNVTTNKNMRGVIYWGTILITNNHIISSEEDYIQFGGNWKIPIVNHNPVQIKDIPHYRFKDKDLVAFNLAQFHIESHRSLVNHIMEEDDLTNISIDKVLFGSPRYETEQPWKLSAFEPYVTTEGYDFAFSKTPISIKYNDICIDMVRNFSAVYQSQPGDCGMPIVAYNPACPRKILGVHYGYDSASGRSQATPLTKEMCDRISRNMGFNFHAASYPDVPPFEKNDFSILDPSDCVEIVGTVKDPFLPRSPSRTKLRPTMLKDQIYTSRVMPSAMRPVNGIDPLRKGIEANFTPNPAFDFKHLTDARIIVQTEVLRHNTRYRFAGVLSDDHTLNGMPGCPEIEKFDLSTSAGYPFSHCTGAKGKTQIVELVNEKYRLKAYVAQLVCTAEKSLSKGYEIPFVLIDTKKDEKRAIEKVEMGKTRIFQNLNFVANFILKKYCQSFIAHLYVTCVKSICAVGINPHSDQWGLKWLTLCEKGNNFMAGDYSSYDKTLPFPFFMEACNIINNFYNDEHSVLRTTLFRSIVSGFHICGNTMYRAHKGMPSGAVITSTVNSVINCIAMVYCYLNIMRRNYVHDDYIWLKNNFFTLVSCTFYGDDHILSVHDDIADDFNMLTTKEELEKLGMKYTTNSKKQIDAKFIPVTEVSFLCRKFSYNNNVWSAPLDFISMIEMWNWTHKGSESEDDLHQNISAFFDELTHYPRQYFQVVHDYCRKKCEEAMFPMQIYDFDTCWRRQRSVKSFELHTSIQMHADDQEPPSIFPYPELQNNGEGIILAPANWDEILSDIGSMVEEMNALNLTPTEYLVQANIENDPIPPETFFPYIPLYHATHLIHYSMENQIPSATSALFLAHAFNMHIESHSYESDSDEETDFTDVASEESGYESSPEVVDTIIMHAEVEANNNFQDVTEKSTQGATGFTDKAMKTFRRFFRPHTINPAINPYPVPDIVEFVSRPYIIDVIDWLPTSPQMLYNGSYPFDLFKQKPIWDKLKNFEYFRCKGVEITFRTNGMQTHYGTLLITNVPQYFNGLDATTPNQFDNIYALSPNAVEKNATNDSAVTVFFPFILQKKFINITDYNKFGSSPSTEFMLSEFARVRLAILNPVLPSTVKVTIIARFIEPTIAGYGITREDFTGVNAPNTFWKVAAPTGFAYMGPRAKPKTINTINMHADAASSGDIAGAEVQSADPERANASEASKKIAGANISTWLARSSKIAGMFTSLPGIGGPIALGVSCVSGIGSFIAKAFGYSKPIDISTRTSVIMQGVNTATSRGIDYSNILGIDQENTIGTLAPMAGGSPMDMNISVQMSKWGLLATVTITSQMQPGDVFFGYYVHPLNAPIEGNYVYHNPCSYFMAAFDFFSGSMKFKAQIKSSGMHVGRYRVAIWPRNPQQLTPAERLSYEANLVSHIVDFQGNVDFEFEVPYLQDQIYLPNHMEYVDLKTDPNTIWLPCIGYLEFSIVNTINYLTQPVPPVYFNLWIAGGPDLIGLKPSSHRLTNAYKPITTIEMHAETLIPTTDPAIPMDICFGDQAVHVKDLVMREAPTWVGEIKGQQLEIDAVCPFDASLNPVNGSTSSFFKYFQFYYRFWRGSITYTVLTYDYARCVAYTTSRGWSSSSNKQRYTLVPNNDPYQFPNGTMFFPYAASIYNPLSVTTPFYYNQAFIATCIYDAVPAYKNRTITVIEAEATVRISERASDDFEFICPIGAPTLYYADNCYLQDFDPK